MITDLERLDLGKDVKKDRVREVPPYTGFGTEEDSLTSCQGLEPRAPERDFFKFMNKDRLDKWDRLDKVDGLDRLDTFDRLVRLDRLDKLDKLDRLD